MSRAAGAAARVYSLYRAAPAVGSAEIERRQGVEVHTLHRADLWIDVDLLQVWICVIKQLRGGGPAPGQGGI